MGGNPSLTGVSSDVARMSAASDRVERSTSLVGDLFDTHQSQLYRLARRMARTSDEARDLVQETFVRVARNPGSIPPDAHSARAWLVRILVNVSRDEWRKRLSRGRLDSHHLIETRALAPANQEAALIAQTTIWTAMQLLPPRRRAALVLFELEGVEIKDIARLLGVSAVTVRWHLSRGRRELARIIAQYDRRER